MYWYFEREGTAQIETENFRLNLYSILYGNDNSIYSPSSQGTSVTVEFRVVDEAAQPVFCIRVPITVTPPAVA
ncbi:hypothetical protein EVAR_94909_1 [Eumeta japonica]|uniref:Uncharacterized protein n=1 Tax=Eumeta variegata TaxID=151549 RepID=A0A4C1V9U7_EUMVA|nr:hypothetical protein EVAR_94909_1 [Eumeta japonica]